MVAEREESGWRWWYPSIVMASGLGLGFSPVASGTVGSFWGVMLVLAFGRWVPWLGVQALLCVLLCLVAVPICDRAEKLFAKKDDGRIVADEYMTFPICMLGLPVNGWVLAMAFVTNRVCDIAKPPPAYRLQGLKGGWGVVADDVMASVYSLILNHIGYWQEVS